MSESSERAPILVHGATGFTGVLVTELLGSRGIPYAVSGRNPAKLEALASRLAKEGKRPPDERVVVDLAVDRSVREAVEGRRMVLACAGPFVEVGEPMLAACARAGTHYVDTTGEQRFVADAMRRYDDTAKANGACIVPGVAFEITPASFACQLASDRLGGGADVIEAFYANRMPKGKEGLTRGTKKSALRMLGEREPLQFVDGQLVVERPAEVIKSFALPNGKRLHAFSFPSPEAIVVPPATGARTVRTFMAAGSGTSRVLHTMRRVLPRVARAALPFGDRFLDRAADGPDAEARGQATFAIVAEARKGSETARVVVTGRDPYGLTAELQCYAAARAIAGGSFTPGVVAPSVAFPPRETILALEHAGLKLDER